MSFKYICATFLCICFLSIPLTTFAQDKNTEEEVKQTLFTIFELSKENKYEQLAPYLVYRGNDEQRKWKDICNLNHPDEVEQLKLLSKEINRLHQISEPKFVEFIQQEESEGKWYVWKLEFKNDTKTRPAYFAFLKINGQYAIGDID